MHDTLESLCVLVCGVCGGLVRVGSVSGRVFPINLLCSVKVQALHAFLGTGDLVLCCGDARGLLLSWRFCDNRLRSLFNGSNGNDA